MNCETATNEELEIKLADLAGFKPSSVKAYVHDLISEMANSPDALVRRSVSGMKRSPCPNYCTDWNATMPLAVEHKVNIQWALNDNFMVSCRNVYGRSAPTQGDISTNQLRAIVICLIKVLEAKQ